jgi:GH25 family lysozyme M1 (1,4-beta-N-acetylmuramidase)
MGKRINKYGVLNEHLDFGDKIIHFASVGSGLNFITMNKNNTTADVPTWYQDYGVAKLDLYMRLFYKTRILPDDKSRFLQYYIPLADALHLEKI